MFRLPYTHGNWVKVRVVLTSLDSINWLTVNNWRINWQKIKEKKKCNVHPVQQQHRNDFLTDASITAKLVSAQKLLCDDRVSSVDLHWPWSVFQFIFFFVSVTRRFSILLCIHERERISLQTKTKENKFCRVWHEFFLRPITKSKISNSFWSIMPM